MVTIEIRDLPDDVTAVLRQHAKAAGQSLQSYVREQFIAGARRPDKAEVMAIIAQAPAEDLEPGLSPDTIVEERRELRGE